MSRTRTLNPLLCVFLGAAVLGACGDDDSSDSGAASDNGDTGRFVPDDGDDNGWPGPDLAGTGEAGTVTVNDTTYGIDATRLCDLSDFDAGDDRTREWQIQGVGLADPDDEFSEVIEVDVYTGTTTRDRDQQGIRWDGPEGLYDETAQGVDVWVTGTQNLDGPPLEITDDRVTGELPLRSALGSPSVVVAVDLEMPSGDEQDCS